MPNLSIKNVPEPVVQQLRRQAAANHRSLQGELMALVCRAATHADVGSSAPAADPTSSGWISVDDVHAGWQADQAASASQGPLAVDIIRRDRDSR